jgi:hypothetical protein
LRAQEISFISDSPPTVDAYHHVSIKNVELIVWLLDNERKEMLKIADLNVYMLTPYKVLN